MHIVTSQFSLYCGPTDVAEALSNIWPEQPIVLIGGALDLDAKAPIYRQRVGLEEITCLKFSPDRQNDSIQLYLPDGLPLPNTPQFRDALIRELHTLIRVSTVSQKRENKAEGGMVSEPPSPPNSSRPKSLIVILIGDVPLKGIVGSILAAEFGSRVQVEQMEFTDNGILVAGWEFWREQLTAMLQQCSIPWRMPSCHSVGLV